MIGEWWCTFVCVFNPSHEHRNRASFHFATSPARKKGRLRAKREWEFRASWSNGSHLLVRSCDLPHTNSIMGVFWCIGFFCPERDESYRPGQKTSELVSVWALVYFVDLRNRGLNIFPPWFLAQTILDISWKGAKFERTEVKNCETQHCKNHKNLCMVSWTIGESWN